MFHDLQVRIIFNWLLTSSDCLFFYKIQKSWSAVQINHCCRCGQGHGVPPQPHTAHHTSGFEQVSCCLSPKNLGNMKAQSHRDTCSPLQPQSLISTQLKINSKVLYKPLQVTIAEPWPSLKAAVTDSVFLHVCFSEPLFSVLSFSLSPAKVTFPHHSISVPVLCLTYCEYFPWHWVWVFLGLLGCWLQQKQLWLLPSGAGICTGPGTPHLWWCPGSTKPLVSAGSILGALAMDQGRQEPDLGKQGSD